MLHISVNDKLIIFCTICSEPCHWLLSIIVQKFHLETGNCFYYYNFAKLFYSVKKNNQRAEWKSESGFLFFSTRCCYFRLSIHCKYIILWNKIHFQTLWKLLLKYIYTINIILLLDTRQYFRLYTEICFRIVYGGVYVVNYNTCNTYWRRPKTILHPEHREKRHPLFIWSSETMFPVHSSNLYTEKFSYY